MLLFVGYLLLAFVGISAASRDTALSPHNAIPKYPYDPNTTKWCTWWLDSDGTLGCEEIQTIFGVSSIDFIGWNPSVTESCGKLPSEVSFCLAASMNSRPKSSKTLTIPATPSTTTVSVTVSGPVSTAPPAPPTTTTISITVSRTTFLTTTAIPSVVTSVVTLPRPSPSTTRPSNGVSTPAPYQDGMVDNCSAFYFTKEGDTCSLISAFHRISLQEFISWNPGVGGAACPSLWADTYVCVDILGRPPTKTKVGNGVSTPAPIQPGITDRCKSFYFVSPGDTCEAIAAKYRISVQQLVQWNPGVKPDCTGLWANSYCCVGTL